ncbi:ABCB family ABC transporter ATP-binding protein/permease [Croceicoccus naphthovorans]|uniref:Metal ABC transporter permease n=1 Tax=Croceicoccus naphthovorans TaxID=1348774 RepID=A0A0G3XBB0_9SPHN|nr:ABC transporter ATP-binding protein/permease [Croceicoccus naphthovorans]AKM08830.1 metal ABC transporter permease [Croceicoccus naphthovorans]MBB3991728.1 ATP-binding cassette subfamily B protein [Croceicoccus naphthovorans]
MPPDHASLKDADLNADWRVLQRFVPYLWPKDRPALRRRIVIAMIMVLLAKAVTLALPFAYKLAVDAMTTPSTAAAMGAMALVIAYAAGRFGNVLFNNLRNIAFERVGQDATRHLAEDVFARLHQLSLRFHLSRRTGEVTKTIERGTKSIDTMLYFMLFNIAPTIIELIAVAVIFYINFGWTLVTATAVTVVAYVLATRWITEWRTKLRMEMNALDGQALSRAVDSLLNYETVKYFGAEHRELDRYARATRAYADAAVKSENSLGLLNIAQAVIMNLLMGFAMAYTVWGWSQGRLTTGDLVLVNTYLTQLFRPLDMLGMVYRTIRQGLIDMAEMFKLMDTSVEVSDAPNAHALDLRRATVVFDKVRFGYEDNREILHGLSFAVEAGERVAIVGPSGAGKSTLARLLFRFYDPQGGRILIGGKDIRSVTQESLRSHIGIVPQDSVLFNDTIGYNIAYGREGATRGEIEAAARGAAIADFIERLPEGYETEVGERGLKLSGGEKQRVAIARTLLKNPEIILFDEATSALDSRTEQDIVATMRSVARSRTTLTIAHRLSTVADADRILVLDQGRLAESGSHADLLAQGGLYAEMWTRQQAEREDLSDAAE